MADNRIGGMAAAALLLAATAEGWQPLSGAQWTAQFVGPIVIGALQRIAGVTLTLYQTMRTMLADVVKGADFAILRTDHQHALIADIANAVITALAQS